MRDDDAPLPGTKRRHTKPSHTPLCCPSCRGAGGYGVVSQALTDDGRCRGCGVIWPTVRAWQRDIAVVHADPQAAETLRAAVAVLRRAMARAAEAPTADKSTDDSAGDEAELASQWARSLWTWGPAHLGRYLQPASPQPDVGWVTALLSRLDDLPPGPVLLLGGAVGGEALALPTDWTRDGPAARAVVCLESHPWLLAGAALATADDAHFAVLRRPGVLSWRPLILPAEVAGRLARTQLVLGDAHDPPFAAGTFAAIIALNVVDSVRDPWLVMQQCEALLKTDGALLISSPWHFQPEITADSQRLDHGLSADGDLPWLIAGRLTGAALPGVLDGLALQHLQRGLPWRVRIHDRLTWQYDVDVLLLRRIATHD